MCADSFFLYGKGAPGGGGGAADTEAGDGGGGAIIVYKFLIFNKKEK